MLLYCKKKFTIQNDQVHFTKKASDWVVFIIPRHENPLYTDQLETPILEFIHSPLLGEFRNVFQAKQWLTIDSPLLENFGKDYLRKLLQQFNYETEGILSVVPFTIKKPRELLDQTFHNLNELP